MALVYILDTNTLIYFFKGMGAVSERLLTTAPKEIAIPTIVLYELEVGIAKSTSPKKRQKQLEELCSLIDLLPFGLKEARTTANIRAKLEKKGVVVGPLDLLIAGTAIANNGILVTNNTKEFSRIAKLQLENWFE